MWISSFLAPVFRPISEKNHQNLSKRIWTHEFVNAAGSQRLQQSVSRPHRHQRLYLLYQEGSRIVWKLRQRWCSCVTTFLQLHERHDCIFLICCRLSFHFDASQYTLQNSWFCPGLPVRRKGFTLHRLLPHSHRQKPR